MSAIQNEIIEMTQRNDGKPQQVNVSHHLYELELPFDDYTDREIGKLDIRLKTALNRINQEKEKRAYLKKFNDSLNSSNGTMTARNFLKSSNHIRNFQNLINNNGSNQQESLTQRS